MIRFLYTLAHLKKNAINFTKMLFKKNNRNKSKIAGKIYMSDMMAIALIDFAIMKGGGRFATAIMIHNPPKIFEGLKSPRSYNVNYILLGYASQKLFLK